MERRTFLPDGNAQAMQQFVGQSPWEWPEVWARLGKRMTAELEPDSAWVVDDTGFPKFGKRRGVEGQGLEKDSLAGRVEGLAGVTLHGCAGPTLPRVRSWASTAPGNLAASGMA